MHSLKRVALGPLAALLLLAVAKPAPAALINDYSQSDDVWNTPVDAGHFLLDVRAGYTTGSPATLTAPTLSLVYGVAPGLEAGIWGGYSFSGIGTPAFAASPQVLNPYLKWRLPISAGGTTFGLVAGVQIPIAPEMEHDVALEGVASIPLGPVASLDIGLGAGRNLVGSAALAHGNLALYTSLPAGMSLLTEAYATVTGATPAYGQHVGLLLPLGKSVTCDVGIAAAESAGGFAGLTPQVGLTWTL